ncbi:MAG: Ldh family oxidoreductase [Chitinophagales bacterium]|nr:Ldh family oxidoreductase [Hyphomicrobiales bacterium]
MIVLTPSELAELITGAMEGCGVAPASAASVARALTQAEVDGHEGHGASRIPSYSMNVLCGKVDGRATPVANRVRPGLIHVNASHGFAYPAIDLAIDHLASAAKEQGMAAAAISHSHHFGVAGYHAERLAERGLMALVVSNAPKAIAAWGGKRPMFGTNPIAFAAPRESAPPLVIDMALSRVARGLVMKAAQTDEPIPDDWALDADGRPTTNAKAAMAGTMAPVGGAKGAALAMMIDLIGGAFIGAHFGFEASSFFDDKDGPPNVGQLLIAFDATALIGGAYFSRIETLISEVESEDGVRLPGARRLARREAAARDGLSIPSRLIDEAKALAARN